MASDHQALTQRPEALIRLESAVGELERVLDRFESAHRATAEELARTRAELTALRTLHETVSHRLDNAIARLKAALADDDEDGNGRSDG
jgi:chromosome segregation ATPase